MKQYVFDVDIKGTKSFVIGAASKEIALALAERMLCDEYNYTNLDFEIVNVSEVKKED